jgi:cobalt-zinc-cadmium efflux system outer membrane protein
MRALCCAIAWLLASTAGAFAQSDAKMGALPSPLALEHVRKHAREHRAEIAAARARAQAAAERPAIVSALEDPMISPSLDHLPFMLHGADVSLTIEQRFPLSSTLSSRGRSARADAKRLHADAARVVLDVELDAVRAFFMLHEQRQMKRILAGQLEIAKLLVDAASARYASAAGAESDVLRAELETARLQSALRANEADIRAAEAMLNAALGRDIAAELPELDTSADTELPAEWSALRRSALHRRPELAAGRAEIERAEAEISVMDSMYSPMALVRTGPAYTMTDGWGWMLMVGVSVPLWRGRLDAGTREARAMATMARADLDAMKRMVEGDAASARELVLAARERFLARRDDLLPRARRALDPALAGYGAGSLPLVSVLDAAAALWSSEAELLAAEVELGYARARLERASAGKKASP